MNLNKCCNQEPIFSETSYGWIIKCNFCKREVSNYYSFVPDELGLEEIVEMWNKPQIRQKSNKEKIEEFLDSKNIYRKASDHYKRIVKLIEEYEQKRING